LQEEIITAVMEGKDTLAMLPTGGGKSLCYQVPALAQDGFCLVVSPLIALMQDQVMQLQEKGIGAAYIHSGMNARQLHRTLALASEGAYRLLYVAPERLQSDVFREYSAGFDLNLIAVDEAHCISQWGHDFRPAYRKIHELRAVFPEVPLLALTASANAQVREDILAQLRMHKAAQFRQSVIRDNLFYHVRYTENKPTDTGRLFSSVSGSGILYCRSRKRCVEAALQLQDAGLKAGVYHAGMAREEREQAQLQWMSNRRQVMCATTAFGMGIDKPDVRIVAHYDAPLQMEEYYQEAGRAGRDGRKAYAVLFYNQGDIIRLQQSTEISYPPEAYLKEIYQRVGDYLGMPVGSGFEELQAFDAMDFVHKFRLETLKALSAIRLLDREGFWQWNEQARMQTIVQFTTRRETLEYLQQSEPALSYIATGLLRLYGSIFHFPTAIQEFEVSKLLRIEKPQLDRGLQRLAALGIIDYQPAIAGGTLYWMHNRLPPAALRLDMPHIRRLKSIHEERVQAMIGYLQNETTCRNVLLSGYFGETVSEACGGCDVCRRQSPLNEVQTLREQVLAMIRKEQQLSLAALTAAFPEAGQDHITELVRTLNDEGLCRIYPTGVIFAAI